MYAVRKDTLAGLKQSSLFEARKIDVPLSATTERLNGYMNAGESMASPEVEAFKFYFMNHVFSLIAAKYDANEPLPDEVRALARYYVKLGSAIAVRLVYYTLLIITREARHYPGPSSLIAEIKKENAAVGAFCEQLTETSEGGIADRLRSKPPACTVHDYVYGMVRVHNEGDWGGGYGGPKWGNIAETLRRMIAGETSAEMFADTAFTLAHNGGPMFNKGMLYHMQNNHLLYKILDVQRSGQIPMLLNELGKLQINDPEFKDYMTVAFRVFPELNTYVDWFKVEALGSLHKYPNEKSAQVAKHGQSKWGAEEAKREAEKARRYEAVLSAKNAAEKNKFFVGAGVTDYAVKVKREAIA